MRCSRINYEKWSRSFRRFKIKSLHPSWFVHNIHTISQPSTLILISLNLQHPRALPPILNSLNDGRRTNVFLVKSNSVKGWFYFWPINIWYFLIVCQISIVRRILTRILTRIPAGFLSARILVMIFVIHGTILSRIHAMIHARFLTMIHPRILDVITRCLPKIHARILRGSS